MYNVILDDASVVTASAVMLSTGAKPKPTLIVDAENQAAFLQEWNKLTPSALDQVQIYNGSSLIAGFEHCDLEAIQITPELDGSMTVYFHLVGDEAPLTDPEYEEAYKIVAGETE